MDKDIANDMGGLGFDSQANRKDTLSPMTRHSSDAFLELSFPVLRHREGSHHPLNTLMQYASIVQFF